MKRKRESKTLEESLQRLEELEKAKKETEAAKELGSDIHQLFATNELPACQVAKLLKKSARAGLSFQHAFQKCREQLEKAKGKEKHENAASTICSPIVVFSLARLPVPRV